VFLGVTLGEEKKSVLIGELGRKRGKVKNKKGNANLPATKGASPLLPALALKGKGEKR